MSLWFRAAHLLRKAAASRAEQRRFALAGWLVAPAVELTLAVGGLHRALRWIEATSPPRLRRVGREAAPVSLEEGARLVDVVYRLHVVDGACLPKSLLQYWLHRRAGTPVRFVVGVRRSRAEAILPFEAHAWVEPIEPSARPSAEPASQDGFEALLVREASAPLHAGRGQP